MMGLHTSNGQEAKSHNTVTASNRNGFAELGFAELEEEPTKPKLASHIRAAIKRRRLTQSPLRESSASTSRRFPPSATAAFSGTRLIRVRTALGQDVEIMVRAKPRNRARGSIRVVSEAHA
jgi:hypothetical protein